MGLCVATPLLSVGLSLISVPEHPQPVPLSLGAQAHVPVYTCVCFGWLGKKEEKSKDPQNTAQALGRESGGVRPSSWVGAFLNLGPWFLGFDPSFSRL